MNTTPMIILPKLFNWRKATADKVIDKTWEADTLTVYAYKRNLVAHYLDNKPVDIKLVRAMADITDVCKNSFGIALGMYMNEIEWNNHKDYVNFKYAAIKAVDPNEKQVTDKVNNQVVTVFDNIVKNSFLNAKGTEQRHMLRLVDEMADLYYDKHVFNYDEEDSAEFTEDTLNAIERLQMKMQKHLQKANSLAPAVTK